MGTGRIEVSGGDVEHLTEAWAKVAGRSGGPAALSALVDGYAGRLESYKDPAYADGACIQMEAAFREHVRKHTLWPYRSVYVVGPKRMSTKRLEYLDYYGDRPERMTHNASSVLIDGEWWTVDFTYAQFDEQAPWPLVEREDDFVARFATVRFFNES